MRRPSLYMVALGAALSLVAAGCAQGGGGGGGGGQAACTWVIGTMGALSGDFASVGQPIADGVQFAVDQANEEGNLECELEFVSEDSQGDPNQAPALAQKLVSNQELVFCACPYFSGETLATGKIFGKGGVAISGTGTNETIDEQGFPTWFRAVAPDNIQAEVAAAYIKDGLKAETVAVVHDNQDYSKGLAEGVAKNLGGLAAGTFVINPEETDYSAVVEQVADVAPDVVFYGGYTPQAGPLAKQLRDAGVDATFMTDDGSKDPTFGDTAKDAADGALASCPCADPLQIDGAQEYVDAMREAYGEDAPGTFAADMTDVVNITVEALATYEGDPADIDAVRKTVVDYFDNAEGIQGITKSYTWNEDGEFEGGPGDVWIYEWDTKAKNFVSLGPAEELLK